LTVRRAITRAIAPRQLEPEAFVYFSDAVKCWPSSHSGANRSPSHSETATCIARHLGHELAIVRPRVIFAFGARAAGALLPGPLNLTEIHGKALANPAGLRVIPLMHPSTINIAGMRRVGIDSLGQYETELTALFRLEFAALAPLLDRVGGVTES
jgi:uracil-DNA glycosylase family 4